MTPLFPTRHATGDLATDPKVMASRSWCRMVWNAFFDANAIDVAGCWMGWSRSEINTSYKHLQHSLRFSHGRLGEHLKIICSFSGCALRF